MTAPGHVILSRIQQSDGALKLRPAVAICTMAPYGDLLVCAISSQLRHEVLGFDDVITRADADFSASGLKVDSLIRLGLLVTIPESSVKGQLGVISADRLVCLQTRLAQKLRPLS